MSCQAAYWRGWRTRERFDRRELNEYVVRRAGGGDAGRFAGYAGFATQRPNIVGDPTLPAESAHPLGSSTRLLSRQPISSRSDPPHAIPWRAIVKGCGSRGDASRAVAGERSIELRLEVFNLLNTANFGAPAAQLGPASFGTIRRPWIPGSCNSPQSSGSCRLDQQVRNFRAPALLLSRFGGALWLEILRPEFAPGVHAAPEIMNSPSPR